MAVANDGRCDVRGLVKAFAWPLMLVAGVLAAIALTRPAHAIEEAQAARGQPFKVAVFYGSRTDVCYDPGDVEAIRKLTLDEAARLNAHGGVSGRPIELQFFDDRRDDATAVANVRTALWDSQTLAMIGLSNSSRGKAVFDTLGGDILKSGIPFLSNQSVSSLFAAYPNVYTMRASQDTDSVPVIARFTKQLNFARPAFVELIPVALSALGDGLRSKLGEGGLISDSRIGTKDDKPIEADLAAALASVRETRPDLLYLYIGSASIPDFMKELVAMGVTPALFISGQPDNVPPKSPTPIPMPSTAWRGTVRRKFIMIACARWSAKARWARGCSRARKYPPRPGGQKANVSRAIRMRLLILSPAKI